MKNSIPILWIKLSLSRVLAISGLALLLLASPAPAALLDFDFGTPTLETGQNVPFSQTSDEVTAQFSASSGGFSVQNDSTFPYTLSRFSANYLYPNVASSVLGIQFNRQLSNITFDFATGETAHIEPSSEIQLIAFNDGVEVGRTTMRGQWGSDSFPMGNLSFDSTASFNGVSVNIQPGGGFGVLMDNISVAVVPESAHAGLLCVLFCGIVTIWRKAVRGRF